MSSVSDLYNLSFKVNRNRFILSSSDLKTANTFLSEDGSVKIGDMNVSKKLKKGLLQTQIGTPYYMSPEIWNNRSYDASSDIWSLGCMIYEVIIFNCKF